MARRAEHLRAGRLLGGLARRIGRSIYIVAALLEVIYRARPIVGSIEGVSDDRGRNYAAILVSNQPLLGGFRPSPGADPRDGRLDLCAIEAPRSRQRLAWIMFQIYRGRVSLCRETKTERIRSMTVATEHPTTFLGDGEVLQRGTHFEVRVHPASLRLVSPPAGAVSGR